MYPTLPITTKINIYSKILRILFVHKVIPRKGAIKAFNARTENRATIFVQGSKAICV